MPRNSRNFLLSNFFHIMVQGINKEYIFSESIQRDKYLSIITEKVKDYSISIISYCIMHNHAHMLLHSQNGNEISKFMLRVNTTYAKWYNDKKERVGYVFRNRFLSEPILNYKYLYNCISYIHNNPVEANLVDKPDEYEYSSYNDYVKKTGIFSSELLNLLSLSESNYLHILSKSNAQMNLKKNDIIISIPPEKIINEYLSNKKIEKIELLKDRELIRELIYVLRSKTNLTIVDISKCLKINRSKIYRILK